MRQHLTKVSFAVTGREVFDVYRIANPVERRSLAQHRAAAAVDEAANEFVFGIVIGRFGIFPHVEACIALRALTVLRIGGHGKPHAIEDAQRFAVMHPVRLRTKFLVIHSAEARRNLRGFGLGVLPEHSLHPLHVQPQDFIAPAKGMQLRPACKVFKSIVGTVVSAPAQHALHVTAAVVVLVVVLGDCGRLRVQKLPLQASPFRRLHGRIDSDCRSAAHCKHRQHGNEQNVTHLFHGSSVSLPPAGRFFHEIDWRK